MLGPAGSYFFWRTSLDEGVYALAGYPLAPPVNRRRYVGDQPVFQANWQVDAHLQLITAYEHFERGGFLATQPGTRDIDYAAVWATYRF